MAIYIETTRPRTLIRAIREKIEQDEIATWAYDEDGDFTHTALQWKYKAWLRPYIKMKESVILGIVPPANKIVTTEIYSIYMGRFVELLIKHCYMYIGKMRLSPTPNSVYDKMRGSKDGE